MADFEPEAIDPLPDLWQRRGAAELAIALAGLTGGAFPTPHNLRDKLLDLVDWLNLEYCGKNQNPPDEPV